MIRRIPPVLLILAVAMAAWLLWQVRAAPRAPLPGVQLDALGMFWAVRSLLAGATLTAGDAPHPWRTAGAALLLALAPQLAWLPLLAPVLFAATALACGGRPGPGHLLTGGSAALALAGGTLALWLQSGSLAYTTPQAGTGLSSIVFVLVLVAAVVGMRLPPLVSPGADPAWRSQVLLLAPAWLYPLVRLYSLGPWNTGWHFACALIGAVTVLWCALAAVRAGSGPTRARYLAGAMFGGALATFGLGTSTGVAAGCYTLVALIPVARGLDAGTTRAGRLARLALTPALPLSAPFVATWLGVGAALAGGVPLLGGVLWLGGLLAAAAVAVAPTGAEPPGRTAWVAATCALLLGVLAPVVLVAAVQPVVAQLQGGLTPYGEPAIFPAVGLAALSAARRQVAVLPSVLLGTLMLVLVAMVHLLGLLARPAEPREGQDDEAPDALIAAVPWLAWLLGRHPGNRS